MSNRAVKKSAMTAFERVMSSKTSKMDKILRKEESTSTSCSIDQGRKQKYENGTNCLPVVKLGAKNYVVLYFFDDNDGALDVLDEYPHFLYEVTDLNCPNSPSISPDSIWIKKLSNRLPGKFEKRQWAMILELQGSSSEYVKESTRQCIKHADVPTNEITLNIYVDKNRCCPDVNAYGDCPLACKSKLQPLKKKYKAILVGTGWLVEQQDRLRRRRLLQSGQKSS